MSLLNCYSWPYTDQSEVAAWEFYRALKAGCVCSFSKYEVAVVYSPDQNNYFVSILVLTDVAGDDSEYIDSIVSSWLKDCRVNQYQEAGHYNAKNKTVSGCLGKNYKILESFGTQKSLTVSEGSAKPKPATTFSYD